MSLRLFNINPSVRHKTLSYPKNPCAIGQLHSSRYLDGLAPYDLFMDGIYFSLLMSITRRLKFSALQSTHRWLNFNNSRMIDIKYKLILKSCSVCSDT